MRTKIFRAEPFDDFNFGYVSAARPASPELFHKWVWRLPDSLHVNFVTGARGRSPDIIITSRPSFASNRDPVACDLATSAVPAESIFARRAACAANGDSAATYLCVAYLCVAYLCVAYLCVAYLCVAYLCVAYLCVAYLCVAYLCVAYLCVAYLCVAYLAALTFNQLLPMLAARDS